MTPVTFFLFSYYLLQGSRPPNSRCRNPSGETAPVSKKTLICVWCSSLEKKKRKKISTSQNLSSLGEMPLKTCQCRNQPWPMRSRVKGQRVNQTRLKRSSLSLSPLCCGGIIWGLERFRSCCVVDIPPACVEHSGWHPDLTGQEASATVLLPFSSSSVLLIQGYGGRRRSHRGKVMGPSKICAD